MGYDAVGQPRASDAHDPARRDNPETPWPHLSIQVVHDLGLPPFHRQRRRRRPIVVGLVVLVAAVGAIVGVGLTGGPSIPGAGMAPAAFVLAATQTTLSHRTADLVFTGSVSTARKTIALNGTGQADLTAGAFSATVTASGESLVERELAVDGHFYMGMTIDGTDVSTLVAGKPWINIPIPTDADASSLGTGTVDPVNQLALLAQRGNTVRPLGTSVIDGETVSGYAVIPSAKTIAQRIQNEIDSGQLSPAAQKLILKESHSFLASTYTMDVWFDASGLLRRMKEDVATTTASGDVVMTFENYGAPVSISPPAPGDVVSFSAFLAAAQAAESSGSSTTQPSASAT